MKISARHPPRSPSEPMGHPPTFRPDHLPSRSPRSASRLHRQPAPSPSCPPRPAAPSPSTPAALRADRLPRQATRPGSTARALALLAQTERPEQRRALARSSPHARFQEPRHEKVASLARFARYVSEIARLHPETNTWDENIAIFRAKSMHFARTLPGRRPFLRNRREEDTYGTILATSAKTTLTIGITRQ